MMKYKTTVVCKVEELKTGKSGFSWPQSGLVITTIAENRDLVTDQEIRALIHENQSQEIWFSTLTDRLNKA